jgi:hypothetical protein
MAFQSKDGKSYGSAYVAKRKDKEHGDAANEPKRFDSYEGGKQPSEENDNSKAEPKEHSEDKVNEFSKSENVPSEHNEHVEHEAPEATVQAHGLAHTVHYKLDHENGQHQVRSLHDDNYEAETVHGSTSQAFGHGKALAFEAGGVEQATSPKKRNHPDQQGAESEERPYEQPDLTI